MILKLKPVLWPPHAKSWLIGKDWCWEGLGAGGKRDDRGWDGWMASPTQWTWVWMNSKSWWWTGRPRAAIHGVAKSQTWLIDWTELKLMWTIFFQEISEIFIFNSFPWFFSYVYTWILQFFRMDFNEETECSDAYEAMLTLNYIWFLVL